MIIYLTVVGLLLISIGVGGLLLAFGTFERIICVGTILAGALLCVGAARVSGKQQEERERAPH